MQLIGGSRPDSLGRTGRGIMVSSKEGRRWAVGRACSFEALETYILTGAQTKVLEKLTIICV